MPGLKKRTKYKKKRRPPVRKVRSSPQAAATLPTPSPASVQAAVPTPPTPVAPATSSSTPVTPPAPTASEKKLRKSKFHSEGFYDEDTYKGYLASLCETGSRVFEFQGLKEALLRRCSCSKCGGGPIELREDFHRREGLVTHPYLFCPGCKEKDYIEYSRGSAKQKRFQLNQRSVLANKCIGGTHPSMQLFCSIMELPLPLAYRTYSSHSHAVCKASELQVKDSMEQARCEVREHYGVGEGEVAEILVSCDGSWQKCGFTSLYGVSFMKLARWWTTWS